MNQTAKDMLDANGYVNLQTTIRVSRAPQQPPAPQLSASILPTVNPHLSLPGPQLGTPSAPHLPVLPTSVQPIMINPGKAEEAGGPGGGEGPKPPDFATKSSDRNRRSLA